MQPRRNDLFGGPVATLAQRVAAAPPSTRLLAGVLVIAAIALLWFATIPHGILVGDDLGLVYGVLHGQIASSIPQAFTTADADKYRPVLNVLYSFIIPLFGTHFGGYEALNIVIEIVSAIVLAGIILRITRGNQLLALGGALAFVVSRFAYFNVMQVQGLLESVSLLFLLLMIRDAADAFALDRYERLLRTVGWYALAIFTDERYLVTGLFIVVCALLHPQRGARPRVTALTTGGTVAAFLVNVAVKRLIFQTHVLVGTGGTLVQADPSQWIRFTWAALANVLGFNVGPDYLSGLNVAEAGVPGYLLGLLVAVPALALFAGFAVEAYRDRTRRLARDAAIALALFVPLLVSSAVTIRQEFRWLYAPDAIFILAIAAVAAVVNPRTLAVRAAVIVFAASIAGSMWYRNAEINTVFFMNAMGIASGVRDAIASDPADPIVVADHGDASLARWVFRGDKFAAVYGLTATPIMFVREVTDAHPNRANVVSVQGAGVVRAGSPAGAAGAPAVAQVVKPAIAPFERTVVSFTKTFDKGTINDPREIGTPNKRGAGILAWPGPGPGGTVESLTVVDRFRYTYPPARIHRGEALAFYSGRPFPNGAPTRAFVTVRDGPKSRTVFDEPQPVADVTGIKWKRHVVDLSGFAGRSVAITFGADAIGDGTSAWVAFGFAGLIDVR